MRAPIRILTPMRLALESRSAHTGGCNESDALPSSLPGLLMVTSMTLHADEWKDPTTWKSGSIPGSIIGLDSEGRIIRLVLADGREIQTSYSVAGAIERQRTSNGHTLTYRYDTRGNLLFTSEDGRTHELIYDSDGELGGLFSMGPHTGTVRKPRRAATVPGRPPGRSRDRPWSTFAELFPISRPMVRPLL